MMKNDAKDYAANYTHLSLHNRCLMAIPDSVKDAVMHVLIATYSDAWEMTELGQRLWWPSINRDLLNKSKQRKKTAGNSVRT